jgi:murein tripeptide amidase MpaA
MERVRKAWAPLVLWVMTVLVAAAFGAPPSERCILVKIGYAGQEQGRALLDLGLDIWEFQKDSVLARVTDEERRQIGPRGYEVQTITEDVYTYLETLRKEQISAFAGEPMTYHSYDQIVQGLIALEASGVAQTKVIGSTHEGRAIWAIKISDHPALEEDEPGAIFLGCHHAREWISVEVPFYLARHLVNSYARDARVKHLVDNCEIWIVPVVNPDGYEYTRTRDRLWRKNRRNNGNGTFGVDLNRNYGYMWDMAGGASTNSSHEDYRGPSAFSEPESQAVRDLVGAHDFQVLMSYHSYWQVTYTPWGYTTTPCRDDAPLRAMTFRMRELIRQTSGVAYTDWWDTPGIYPVSGDTGDWSYGALGIYSFGIELPPATAAQGGFVLPESRIRPTCEENLPAALHLTSLCAAQGGIMNLGTGRTYGSLQFAVNDARDGDEIVLDPGVYQESVYFLGKRLTLRSLDPNDPNVIAATVIDGYHYGPALTTSGRGDKACVLAGLTITGQTTGVSCGDAAPTIVNCTVAGKGPNAIDFWEGFAPVLTGGNVIGQVTELCPGLLACWKLDEIQGAVAADSVGTKDGTVVGSPLWQPTGGHNAGALQCDGVDDYVRTPFLLDPARGPLSVFAWVKGGGPGQVILAQQGAANWLRADAAGRLTTELKAPRGAPLASPTVVTDGRWHRVGVTWDGDIRILYLDDVEIARDAKASGALPASTGGLHLGAGSTLAPGTFWSGWIDDVRLYHRAVKP